MKIGPKYKIAKRLGAPLFEKTQTQKFAQSASRSAKTSRRRGPQSDFGKQLFEKQKARFTYGIGEKQFARYVKESMEAKGTNPTQVVFERLETRLDNVVYRMGIAKTRLMARQLVSHGHIKVNGRKVTIPSYAVKVGDILSIRNKDKAVFGGLEELHTTYNTPTWVSFDAKRGEGKVAGVPTYDPTEHLFSLSKVIEFYSR